MVAAQSVALRFQDLVEQCKVEELRDFLDDKVVVSTWNGTVFGLDKAMNFFEDFQRYSHYKSNFNKWRQVQHCLDPSLKIFDVEQELSMVAVEDRVERARTVMTGRVRGGDPRVAKYFDSEGYDSQGYSLFEREGWISSHPKMVFTMLHVRQTIAVKDGKIILYQYSLKR